MTSPESTQRPSQPKTLAEVEEEPSFFADMLHFLRNNKKWWMVPMLLSLLVFGLLLLLSGTAVAPFIYTLF